MVLGQIQDAGKFAPGPLMFFVVFMGVPWASGVGLRVYRERKAGETARTTALLAEESARNLEALEAERSRRLPELIADISASGVPVDLRVSGDLGQVPPGVDLSAYRVIQEALTNVIKHAGNAQATVTVCCTTEDVEVSVSDNGKGTSTGHSGGHGIAGIKERVNVLGGTVQAEAGPASGFIVRARLPYQVRS